MVFELFIAADAGAVKHERRHWNKLFCLIFNEFPVWILTSGLFKAHELTSRALVVVVVVLEEMVFACLLLTPFLFYFTSAGKLVAYDTDGDGDFDVEDAKILLGKLAPL